MDRCWPADVGDARDPWGIARHGAGRGASRSSTSSAPPAVKRRRTSGATSIGSKRTTRLEVRVQDRAATSSRAGHRAVRSGIARSRGSDVARERRARSKALAEWCSPTDLPGALQATAAQVIWSQRLMGV